MYNMDDIRERVILVGVDTEGGETAERSLDELAELAATAGAEDWQTDPDQGVRTPGNLYRAWKTDRIKRTVVGN